MNQNQLEKIEDKLRTLSIMELDYFRNWLMNNYPIYGMAHDVEAIMFTVEGVEVKYKDAKKILDNIKDQSKWVLDVSYFLENEKNGYYRTIEAEQITDNFSEFELINFINYLKEKYPIYNKKEIDYRFIHNSFGKKNYPKWVEIREIIIQGKYKK